MASSFGNGDTTHCAEVNRAGHQSGATPGTASKEANGCLRALITSPFASSFVAMGWSPSLQPETSTGQGTYRPGLVG